jgi:uncharacterized protein (TIGR02145 family)
MKLYNKVAPLFFFVSLFAIGTGCKKNKDREPIPQPTGVVSIEGKEYTTVTIGNQVWTKLNYSGPGGIGYETPRNKPEYGKYYTFEEVAAIHLPEGWRLPTKQDYLTLAQHQGIAFTGNRATNQEAVKKLSSTTNWRSIPGTNASGFDAQPGGYSLRNQPPQDGDIAEFWTAGGSTFSIQESADGKTHIASFYGDSNSPEYRFNLRFVRNR